MSAAGPSSLCAEPAAGVAPRLRPAQPEDLSALCRLEAQAFAMLLSFSSQVLNHWAPVAGAGGADVAGMLAARAGDRLMQARQTPRTLRPCPAPPLALGPTPLAVPDHRCLGHDRSVD